MPLAAISKALAKRHPTTPPYILERCRCSGRRDSSFVAHKAAAADTYRHYSSRGTVGCVQLDPVEIVNQCWNALGSTSSATLVEKLRDVNQRRRVIALTKRRLKSSRSPIGVRRLADLLDEPWFVDLISSPADPAKSTLVADILPRDVKRWFDSDDQETRDALQELVSAVWIIALKDASIVERTQLAATARSEEASLWALQVGIDTYDRVEEVGNDVSRIAEFLSVPDDDDYTFLDIWSIDLADEINRVSTLPDGSEALLAEGLYVERHIESELERFASADSQANVGIVVGDPGAGKSSLLWSLWHRLLSSESHRVWLVSASSLLGGPNEQGPLPLLLAATRSDPDRGSTRSVILIDTLDLVLRADESIDRARLALDQLGSQPSVSVIASCRPLEARRLPNRYLRFGVGDYSPIELRAAFAKHSRSYARAGLQPDEQHQERLLNSVRSGVGIGPLLRRPLTLRMLFELYSPTGPTTTTELNMFTLLSAYWSARVNDDIRLGHTSIRPAPDLARPTFELALAMVGVGDTSVDRDLAVSLFPDTVTSEALHQLQSRGIVAVRGSSVHFFHQVFLEHSAARGLRYLEQTGQHHVSIFDRLVDRPGDAFLWPVAEQLLLLKMSRENPGHEESILLDWLHSSNVLAFQAGIRVFGQHRAPLPAALEALIVILSDDKTDPEVSRMVLASVDSMLEPRHSEIPQILAAAWQGRVWTTQTHVLAMLPRLAEVEPRIMKRFVDTHDVIGHLLRSHDRSGTIVDSLIRALLTSYKEESEWALTEIKRLVGPSSPFAATARIRTAEALSLEPELLDGNVALDELLPVMTQKVKTRKVETSVVYGQMIAQLWTSVGRTSSQLVDWISTQSGVAAQAGCRALFRLLSFEPSATTASLRQLFERLPIEGVWAAKQEIIEWIEGKDEIVSSITTILEGRIQAGERGSLERLLLDSLLAADRQAFIHLLRGLPDASSTEAWEDRDWLGRYLVVCGMESCGIAPDVIDRLAASPGKVPDRTILELTRAAAASPQARTWAMAMVVPQRDFFKAAELYITVLRAGDNEEDADRLLRWLLAVARSNHVDERRKALKALAQIAASSLALEEIGRLGRALLHETDETCIRHLLDCVEATGGGSLDDSEIRHHIEALTSSTNQDIAYRAATAAMKWKASREHGVGEAWPDIWRLVVASPFVSSHRFALRYITDRASDYPDQAYGWLRDVVTSAKSDLQDSDARQLASWLQPCLVDVLRNVELESVRSDLNTLCDGNDHIGMAVVNALIRTYGQRARTSIQGLVSDKTIPAGTQSAGASFLSEVEAATATRWPELLQSLNQ